MQDRQAAIPIALVAAGLALIGHACVAAPGALPPSEPTPPSLVGSAGGAADSTDRALTGRGDEAATPTSGPAAPHDAPPTSTAVAQRPAPRPAVASSASPAASPVASSASPVASPSARPAAAQPSPEPMNEVVAVTLAKDNRIAIVDPMLGKVTRMVDVSRPTGRMTLAPDGHSAWVLGTQPGLSAAIGVLDVASGDRHDDIAFHLGDNPVAIAFASDGSNAYVAMDNPATSPPGPSTIAFASINGHEFGRVTIGRQSPGVQIHRELSSLAVSPGPSGDVLYAAAEQSGVVWALDTSSGTVLSEIEVGGGPTSIIPDPQRQRLYVLVDTLNQIVAIDTTSRTVVGRLDLPARPIGAAVAADGRVFVAGGDASGEVWVVEPGATDLRFRVPIGGRPVGLAVSEDGSAVYVPDSETRSLAILSTDTIQVMRTVPLASEPLAVLAVYGSAHRQRVTAAPAIAAQSPPAAPQLQPTPTPIPEGARIPDRLPAGAVSEPFVTGADLPVAFTFAADGRLFYTEMRSGKIRIVQNGALLPDPFYQFTVADQPESGLLGIALDPAFEQNHYVYAFYTSGTENGTPNKQNQVVRLTDVGNKGTDPTPILQELPSGNIHTSGAMQFGADGKLYVAIGDTDQGTYAQDLGTLAGKVLRVNPDGSVPEDNPFVGDSGKQETIWAYGLHNPHSLAFHPLGHQLLAVDDGYTDNDELDVILRGGNYGWPQAGYRYKPGISDPIAVMNPAIVPTGSAFYTSSQMPEWTNDLFYCNFNLGQLRRVHLAAGSFDRVVYEEVVKQGCFFGVATGPDGALYYSDPKGIYRIRRSDADALPTVRLISYR